MMFNSQFLMGILLFFFGSYKWHFFLTLPSVMALNPLKDPLPITLVIPSIEELCAAKEGRNQMF